MSVDGGYSEDEAELLEHKIGKVCSECKQPIEANAKALIDLGLKPEVARGVTLYRGQGCRSCSNTGYRGRIALYEVMPFTDRLKELVLQGVSTAELKSEAIKAGMKTLRQSGLSKIAEGVTSIEEVGRVTAAD